MRTCLGIVMAMCLFLAGAVQAQAAPLTDDTLKGMLENIGSTVTVTGDKAPRHFKVDKARRSTLSTYHHVRSSSRRTPRCSGSTPGSTRFRRASRRRAALLALLAKNDEIGPIFFSYNTDNKLLYLNAPTANVDITPAVLRQKIKTFITRMDSTYSLWNVKTWK
jgi:hypothetical protein